MDRLSRRLGPGHAYRLQRMLHRKERRPTHRVGKIASALVALIVGMGALAGTAAGAMIGYFATDLPAAHDLERVQIPLSTYIYDRSGQHVLFRLEDERRIPVTLDKVPLLLQAATVAIEDQTFWTNPGIDIGGIMRAFQANMANGTITQGGSTITQQLIKTRLLGDEVTLERKAREALLALEVTRAYSKERILEMYFNQIYYGNQAYGILAAAYTYYGISNLHELSLGQMAMLAGLPQAPSDYDPVQNPDAARARRSDVLNAMVDNKYITREQADAAAAEPVKVTPAEASLFAPHFTFRVREQLVRLLGEKAAYQGGYRVYTTLDWNMQQLAEKEVRDHVNGLRSSNVNNASLITMDPTTGEILAYVGSKDYYDRSPKVRGDYDVAGIAYRQPGSTFKLFTYLTGMLRAGMTPSTQLWDVQFKMPGGDGKPYEPKDATGEQHGPVTLRQALRESLNLPALQITRQVGVDAIMETIAQLGIQRDWGERSRYGLSFGIGAGEMRLIDMASAYQVIANKGMRVEPTMILKIVDRDGNVVTDFSKPEGRRVLDEQTAWIMTDILKDMTDPQNGSFVFGPFTNIGRPAALKTGTTDNLQDVLAIGYTPQRLTAIWMGNSDNSEMQGISSALGPGILWRDYMRSVVGGLPPDGFPRPASGIVETVVCVNPSIMGGQGSGDLPGGGCPSNWRKTEVFKAGTEPKAPDTDLYGPGGCVRVRAPFADWQRDYDAWAAAAAAGRHSYGRFSWSVCGLAPPAAPSSGSPQPSASPGPTTTPRPTSTPRRRD